MHGKNHFSNRIKTFHCIGCKVIYMRHPRDLLLYFEFMTKEVMTHELSVGKQDSPRP